MRVLKLRQDKYIYFLSIIYKFYVIVEIYFVAFSYMHFYIHYKILII